MGRLKDELEKEKELRKIAEDKLLEILDHEKRMEAQRRERYDQKYFCCCHLSTIIGTVDSYTNAIKKI